MPSYTIKHVTRYSYAAEVIDGANQIMLYPLADERLQVTRHEVCVSSDAGTLKSTPIDTYVDAFGNTVGMFTLLEPHTVLAIESTAHVTTLPIQFPMDEEPAEQQWQDLRSRQFDPAFIDFLTPDNFESLAEVENTLRQLTSESEKPLKNALVLSEYVFNNFEYRQGVTNVETPAEDIWRLKAGVCQDFAHILLALLRQVGIPARYVSGYVCPTKKEGQAEVRGIGATHAWAEAYIPFYGWLGLDPTNNTIVNDEHVRMAIGRNFPDCTPVKGTYKGISTHKLHVSVQIEHAQPERIEIPVLAPAPVYQVPDPEMPANSFRLFQLQQQQQQQQ